MAEQAVLGGKRRDRRFGILIKHAVVPDAQAERDVQLRLFPVEHERLQDGIADVLPDLETALRDAELRFIHRAAFARDARDLIPLRAQGYEVTGIACKCGTVNKTELGIPERCLEVGQNICNPVLQALVLNGEKTELNIALGLCVGHDSMFYKYSEAPVTTLSAKDRLLCHASLGPLYLLDGYWKRLLKPDPYLTAPQSKTEEGKTGDTSN